MGSSTLRVWGNHADLGQHELLAAGDANDDVELSEPKSTGGSGGLRRLQGHYSQRSKFFGTVLPRASSLSTSPALVCAVLSALWGVAVSLMRRALGPSSTTSTALVRAVGVPAEAAVADDEECAASPAALNDDVK